MTPAYDEAGGDTAGYYAEKEMREDFRLAEQPFDAVGAWFFRTAFDTFQTSAEYALSIHRAEWREMLDAKRAARGLPPVDWPTESAPQE